MIQINDEDLPITVAEKIINGTMPSNSTPTIDMFDLEEIKEIADYLIVYYDAHKNGD